MIFNTMNELIKIKKTKTSLLDTVLVDIFEEMQCFALFSNKLNKLSINKAAHILYSLLIQLIELD